METVTREQRVSRTEILGCYEWEKRSADDVGKLISVSRSVTLEGKEVYKDKMSAEIFRTSRDSIRRLELFLLGVKEDEAAENTNSQKEPNFFRKTWERLFVENSHDDKDRVILPYRMSFTSTERPYEKLWRKVSDAGLSYAKERFLDSGPASTAEDFYHNSLLGLVEAGLKYKELELSDPDLSSLPIKHPYCKLYDEIGPEILQNYTPGAALPLDCKKSILQAVRSLHELPKVDEVRLRQQCYSKVPDDTPYSSRLSFAQDLYDWITNSTPESPKEEKEVSDGK